MSAKPEQLEQLLSEASDGLLTASQRAELDRVIAEDPKASAELRRYDRLAEALRDWRRLPATADFSGSRRALVEFISSADHVADATSIDASLRGFRPLPNVDWKSFQERIGQAIRQDALASDAPRVSGSRRRSGWRILAGIGTPLAAAAAVVIAVLWQRPEATLPNGSSGVASTISVQLAIPSDGGRIEFGFNQTPSTEDPATSLDELPGSAIAIGPGAQSAAEVPDTALLF